MRMRTTAVLAAAVALIATGQAYGVASAAVTGTDGGALTAQPLPPGTGRLFDTVQVDAHTTWAGGMWQTSPDGKAARDTPLLLSRDDRDGRGWQQVPLPAAGGSNEINAFAVVPGSGGRDAWAVGLADSSLGDGLPGHGAPGPILADHWDGTSWQALPVPLPEKSEFGGLTGISATAPDDVWAVGWAQILDSYTPNPNKPGGGYIEDHFETLVEHWDGQRWQRVAAPDPMSYLPDAVVAAGPDDVWTAGYDGLHDVPVVQHWDGSAWTTATLPRAGEAGEIYAMAVDASGGLWAVGRTVLGATDPGHALVLHQVAGHWTKVQVPPTAGQLNSLAITPGGITAAGDDPGGRGGYAMRFDGTGWQRLALPAADGVIALLGIAYGPEQGLVVVGDTEPAGGPLDAKPLVLTDR